jgi:hypothetical protein
VPHISLQLARCGSTADACTTVCCLDNRHFVGKLFAVVLS